MDKKRVRDVIGEPDSWPNTLGVAGEGPSDIRGATIAQVINAGNDLAIRTEGGACGATFSIIAVEDKDLRDGVAHALQVGLDVHEAADTEI